MFRKSVFGRALQVALYKVPLFRASKIFKNAQAALEGVKDGQTILFGGFGLAGIPENSILELRRRKVKNLTAVSNTGGNKPRQKGSRRNSTGKRGRLLVYATSDPRPFQPVPVRA